MKKIDILFEDIIDELQVLQADIEVFKLILNLLYSNQFEKAKGHIYYLDSVVREACLEYLTEGMKNQLGYESINHSSNDLHSKPRKKYTNKQLAERIQMGCFEFINSCLDMSKQKINAKK